MTAEALAADARASTRLAAASWWIALGLAVYWGWRVFGQVFLGWAADGDPAYPVLQCLFACALVWMAAHVDHLVTVRLARQHTVELVGPLAERLLPPTGEEARQANRPVLDALAEHLPALTADDVWRLSAGQARRIYRYLHPRAAGEEPDFALTVLRSLRRTRDTRALPYVRAAVRRLSGDDRLGRAIRRCLPALEAQLAVEHQGLLRPVEAGPSLLRPAPAPAPERLLRPAETALPDVSRAA